MALVVRTTDDPAAMVSTIRQTVAAIDGQLPVYNVQMLRDYVGRQIEQPRLSAMLLFGVCDDRAAAGDAGRLRCAVVFRGAAHA